MILEFTESEKQHIESYGLQVIEFKRLMRELNKIISKAFDILHNFINRFIDALKEIIKVLYEHMRKYNDFYRYVSEMENENAKREEDKRPQRKFYSS